MVLRNKLFPYPVLAYYSDDYLESGFDTHIDAEKEGYSVNINFTAALEDITLNDLVANRKADFLYHLECPSTCFRKIVRTNDRSASCTIADKSINGRLEVCSFIVAAQNIVNFTNESFNPDYQGYKFNVDAGCIMAVAEPDSFDIRKDTDDLAVTPSIFCITKNPFDTDGMVVEMSYKKIIVKLPEDDYYNYRSMKDVYSAQPILNSMVVIPALAYVLEEVSKSNGEYDSFRWYKSIKKVLSLKFGCVIESKQFSDANMLETAQKLINYPISDALLALRSFGRMESEIDEN